MSEKSIKVTRSADIIATWSNFIVESAVKEVADFWFNMSPDEPMDGDETERIGKLFLRTLNERMGNK